MREIARQATAAWGRRGAYAVTAHDLSWIDIPQLQVEESPQSVTWDPEDIVWEDALWDEPQEPDQPSIAATKRKWGESSNRRGGGGFRSNHWKRGRGRGRGGGGRGGHIDTS
ncbi:hypothetical protein FRC12_020633 [Ceratobasidium sp. 428]|nr:hypothetical protein FRC12_020633 [Ceratobasidium sp. 428]